MDFNNLQRTAAEQLAKDTVSFAEGQTLIAIVPYEHIANAGGQRPWLEAATINFPENTGLKRSTIIPRVDANPFLASDDFQAMMSTAGKKLDVNDDGSFYDFVGDGLRSPKLVTKKSPRETTLYLYVVLALARRSSDKGTWSANYSRPQIMIAKKGGRQPHIHDGFMNVVANSDSDKIKNLFVDPKNVDHPIQLMTVTRTGTGMTDTRWDLSATTGKQKAVDGDEANLSANFDPSAYKITPTIQAQINECLADASNLLAYVAGTFVPNPDELREFYAKLGIGPVLSEEEVQRRLAEAQAAAGGKRADG